MNHYVFILFYSDEDNSWIADVPDLEYCSAHGKTREEALHEVLIAIEGWLEVAKMRGYEIPKPKFNPSIYQVVS